MCIGKHSAMAVADNVSCMGGVILLMGFSVECSRVMIIAYEASHQAGSL